MYILGDADRVRERIEGYLLAANLTEARRISERLTVTLSELVSAAERLLGAQVIMAGGDDILLCVDGTSYSQAALEDLARTFHQDSGCTISFGAGDDVPTAYLNLRRAKAAGGNKVVGG